MELPFADSSWLTTTHISAFIVCLDEQHYVSPWDEAARVSFLRALGTNGFNTVLEGIGKTFGLDNMTCFFLAFMGVSECDNSFTHTDIYATGEKAFNMIWPIVIVNGSKPELDIISDDANVVLSTNYETDVSVLMGDWVYHKTSRIDYSEKGQMRIVVNAYCGQIDESNAKMMHYIYDGEDPAPFCDQFKLPIEEIHWGNGISLPK